MSKLRKKSNFTIVSNGIVFNKNISMKAKGIYLYLCSRPDGWDFYLSEIASNCTEGTKAIRTGLRELEDAGYLARERVNGECGQFHYDYEIFETPDATSPHTPKGHTVKGRAAEGHAVNGTVLNTDKSNTDKSNTNNTHPVGVSECDSEFELFWATYGRKGNKAKSLQRWKRLSKAQRTEVMQLVGDYVLATPEKRYRKNAETYLNKDAEHWKDEVEPNQSSDKPFDIMSIPETPRYRI